MNVMTDPFMGTRSGGPQGGATAFADEDESLAYAAKRKAAPRRTRCVCKDGGEGAAARAAVRAALERVGSGLWRRTVYRRRRNGWLRRHSLAYLWRRSGPRLPPRSEHTGRLFARRRGTSYNLANGLGGGRSEMFQAGIYGRHYFGPAYIAGALAYGWQDVTTDRVALLNSYRANFDANAFSGRLEGGYRFGLAPAASRRMPRASLPPSCCRPMRSRLSPA